MSELINIPGGFVDLHTHAREPSTTNRIETFESVSKAAIEGGFVEFNDMPNTPGRETWTLDRVFEKRDRGNNGSLLPFGIYYGSQPSSDNIGQIQLMAPHVIGGKGYMGPTTSNPFDLEPKEFVPVWREHKLYLPDKPYMLHAGNNNLEEAIARPAGDFDIKVHVCHIHTMEEVGIVLDAKKKYGEDRISSEVCAHHMTLTSHDTETRGWLARMMPELVHQDEAEGLLERLSRGDIDAVATDHAPHPPAAKWNAEDKNPEADPADHDNTCYGVPSIELAARVLFYQVKRNKISRERAIDALSTQPARILGIEFDPNTYVTWDMSYRKEIDKSDAKSGAGTTPFAGMIAVGKVVETVIGGTTIYRDGKFTGKRSYLVTRGEVV